MKSIFSHFFKLSLLNRVMRLIIVVVCLSYSAAASATDYYLKCKAAVATNSTAKGMVYITKNEKTSNDAPDEGKETDETEGNWDATSKDRMVTLFAYPEEGYYHKGWTRNDPSGDSNLEGLEKGYKEPYVADVKAESTDKNNPTIITFYAVFELQAIYLDYVQVKAIYRDINGNVVTDPNTGEPVLDGGVVSVGDAIDANSTSTDFAGTSTLIRGGKATNKFSYTYHAQAAKNFVFKGWSESPTGNPLLNDINTTITKEWETATNDENNPYVAPVLYAVFQQEFTYYYTGATAYVAGETEGGEIRVSYDGGANYTAFAPSIQDNGLKSQLNDPNLKIKYDAKVLDDSKYAFRGWSMSSAEGQSSMYPNPHDYEHTMEAENTLENNPYVPETWYAIFASYYYKNPPALVATNSKGSGKVSVSNTTATPSVWYDEMPAGELVQKPATGNAHTYNVTYHAKAEDGARFDGWYSSADASVQVSTDNPYTRQYATSSMDKDNPMIEAPLYAAFRSDIDIRQQDRMIVYIDDEGNGNINDSKVLIDFQKANTLTATLSDESASLFSLSNRSGSKSGSSITFDATQGLIELVVTYKGDLEAAVGKVANITLSATYGGKNITRPVTIVVEEAPIITFLPTDGKGAYTIKMTNGSGINYTMNADVQENIKVPVTHESMSNIEMNLTNDVTTDKYYFFGWQIIEGDVISYLSYDKLCTYQFTKPVKVRAEFIPNNAATFIIKEDETGTPYYDLKRALEDASIRASRLGPQVVVFNNEYGKTGAAQKTGILAKPKNATEYVIPNEVTLLIPYSADFVARLESLTVDDYVESGSASGLNCYRKLILEDGTNIRVERGGNICVGAQMVINGLTVASLPYKFGHIELGNNCHIQFEEGSTLFAWGYITNPAGTNITNDNINTVGRVTIDKGATVHESFMYADWRGGNATADFIQLDGIVAGIAAAMGINTNGYRYQVFPMSQYYIQNVEAPMTIRRGATEILSTAVYTNNSKTRASVTFMAENAGLFRLKSDDVSVTKYYDPLTDRLKMYVHGSSVANSKATLGTMELNLGSLPLIGDLGCNSKDYVLPINNNMDVSIENVTITSPYNMAMMAGSTFNIASTAYFKNEAQVYVYDVDESKLTVNGTETGYCGVYNNPIVPLTKRIGSDLTFKRATLYNSHYYNPINLQDATIIIDGVLENSSTGYLLTTKGGARIISNGGGKVIISKEGKPSTGSGGSLTRNQTPFQYIQGENGQFVAVPMKRYLPALLNGDGTYVDANINTYTYYNDKWNVGDVTAGNTPSITENFAPEFEVGAISLPLTYVGATNKQTLTITPSNKSSVAADYWDNVTWTTTLEGENADQYVYPTGTLTKGVMPSGEVQFKPTSDGKKYATLTISATYSHKADETNATIAYNYVQTIHLIADASYLAANILAFADLSTLYEGQGTINLFQSGSQNNKKDIIITITPNPNVDEEERGAATAEGITDAATITPTKVGSIIIKATQDPDYDKNIAGTTITKTVNVTDAVEWNWSDLYFGTVNTNPVTIHNGATTWTLVEKEDQKNIIDFQGSSPNYTASIADQIAGKYEVTFTYSDDKGVTKDFISTVYTNPRHLRVDVNNDTVYRAVTLSANMQVNYHSNRKAVGFSSTAQNISQWKMTFLGVPDKIYFIPEGDNTWQIEESSNGINWTTSMPWKYLTTNEHFEMSLLPSTSYLRVSYGAGDVDSAYIKELYITELADVKADVKKLYMPVDGVNNAIKEVVLTYASTGLLSIRTTDPTKFQLKFSDSDATPTDVLSIPATTDENPFGIKGVDVVCKAAAETTAELQVYNGSKLVLQIPIYAYDFPQELPIKLATDQPAGGDRYYFVTTHSHNAEWDGTDGVRTLTMNNAVSDAAPYVTFAFDGAPTFISFDYTNAAKGVWNIEESTDGKNFSTVTPSTNDVMADGKFKRTVSTTSKYIKVIYESAYAEKVDLSNITIVGDASVVVNPTKLELDYDDAKQLTLTAINLTAVNIATSSANFKIAPTSIDSYAQTLSLTSTTHPDQLGENKMGDIIFDVKWTGEQMVEYGTIVITNPNDEDAVLATVELTGIKQGITNGDTKIYTGVAGGYTLNGVMDDEGNGIFDKNGAKYRPVDISAAFSNDEPSKPLFDYVVVYGETTTNDGSKTITTPNNNAGSNAKTPYYIYKKSADGNSYVLHQLVENANSSTKAWSQNDDDAVAITSGDAVSMYITGFCPYATTGYTKDEEGVWYFRANSGQSINVYLQDCYIYSRAKTIDGHTFADRSDGQSFVDSYSRGTGAVFVFACNEKVNTPMNVTIHTLDSNLLKSNYGCFLQSIAGRAFQASSPIQIRLIDDTYAKASTVTLNFTDEWPASKHDKTGEGVRTNGFISLQKQVNNAPSIDMGNSNTVVNFNGGQVELQNAQIVSTNYASSLAICPRSGKFAGIFLAYGLGTDDVGGTVNFTDGTTTVQEMWVSPTYFESYLCEKDADGNYIRNEKGEYLTTCLRTPTNTFVRGGSHCMMRACSDPQSQGGAPKNKPGEDGVLLGLYKYPKLDPNPADAENKTSNFGWVYLPSENDTPQEGDNGLVRPNSVPAEYGISSVTPNDNGTSEDYNDDYLNFWFDPTFEPSAQPEIDKKISYWKTCMTRIEAEYAGYGGSVGGDTQVEMSGDLQTELVKNLLYCKIDDQIHEVIASSDYYAPVKNPAPEGGNYLPIHPSEVGQATEHFISNEKPFQVENKLYYITTATADVWNAFTAPFDVANIYIMETYSEAELEKLEYRGGMTRSQILLEQAKHNADFASFFGVTIALGQNKDFETIYGEYMSWAKLQDTENGLYASGKYDLRGMRELIPFDGSNWATADFYLNENKGDWTLKYDGKDDDYVGNFETTWEIPTLNDNTIMERGKTYSMLLPFCMGCVDYETDGDGKFVLDENGEKKPLERTYWDYWSGKFLIFESTDGPHTINGKDYATSIVGNATYIDESAVLTGNSTFAEIQTTNEEIFTYEPNIAHSTFYPIEFESNGLDGILPRSIVPTESFLVADLPTPAGQKIVGITRSGKVLYNTSGDGNTTGTHMPTVGGGNELFITAISGGINVAVAYPQHVRVLSATGAIIYSGMVQTAVDVNLPTDGIYIVSGEREVQKILY